MCRMPFCSMNSQKKKKPHFIQILIIYMLYIHAHTLVNVGPLSVTTVSGKPWIANTCLSLSMVEGAVMLLMM